MMKFNFLFLLKLVNSFLKSNKIVAKRKRSKKLNIFPFNQNNQCLFFIMFFFAHFRAFLSASFLSSGILLVSFETIIISVFLMFFLRTTLRLIQYDFSRDMLLTMSSDAKIHYFLSFVTLHS
jgi:hypothetical protein